MVSVADLCCRCVSVRLLPGDGFVRHQADPDVERKVYPYAWGDGHPQGFGGVAIHGFSGVALRDVDRVRATSIYAECFFGVRVDQTLVLKFPAQCEELAMKLEAFKKEVALLPSVRAVTVSGAVPGTEVTDFLSIVRESDVTKQTRLLEMLNCDEFFWKLMI